MYPLLAKYVDRYTKRNTRDYFIHKDLGGFLNRELDFYIKNEVLNLDGIDDATATFLDSQLVKVKVIRKIASQLIEFLSQLENFQKKLWLKKQFVVETNYCITLDRIPQELYPEIISNEAQLNEWIQLFAINEIQGDIETLAFSRPLTLDFLKVNRGLVLDTKFFSGDFKERLISLIEEFDQRCDGLLVHSENFQALNLLKQRYCQQLRCVYIDPPYNTAASEIIYKNGYKHSSYLALTESRLKLSKTLMPQNGIIAVAIDDAEGFALKLLLDEVFDNNNYVSTIAIQQNPGGRSDSKHIASSHEYLHIYARDYPNLDTNDLPITEKELKLKYPGKDKYSSYRASPFRRGGSNSRKQDRPNMFYPIYYSETKNVLSLNLDDASFIPIWPINSIGEERIWRWGKEKAKAKFSTEFIVKKIADKKYSLYVKDRLKNTVKPKSFWYGARHDAAAHGTKRLKDMFASFEFSYPKSVHTVHDVLSIASSESDTILDYFGGSGTTAAAVITLNRTNEQSQRKYIIVEMGNHFDTVMKPRIAKEVYAENWKDGKPVYPSVSISHCIKYMRLESYEDTLNNLDFDQTTTESIPVYTNSSLRKDHYLRYWLDVELQNSKSLLNVDSFTDPMAYTLDIKKPGSDEYETKKVDLIETFNYLLGLRVSHTSASQTYSARFEEVSDPELPTDQTKKLALTLLEPDVDGSWWFRTVKGWVPKNLYTPNNGEKEIVLIIWRNLTGNLELDNLVLNEWFKSIRAAAQEFDFDRIYVNGSSNLMTLKQNTDRWAVQLLEEKFMNCMWQDSGL